jgi:hypothetical protein
MARIPIWKSLPGDPWFDALVVHAKARTAGQNSNSKLDTGNCH